MTYAGFGKWWEKNWLAFLLYFVLGLLLPKMGIVQFILIIITVLFIEINAVLQDRKDKQ